MTAKALLDTDTLSLLMRRQPSVVKQAEAYLAAWHHFTLSVITRYEVLRGLKAKQATSQLTAFNRFCQATEILFLTEEIVDAASTIYANLYHRGELIGDADILIAATATVNELTVITHNVRHFSRIDGLAVQSWVD
jgi:tRNA(fMet)-specific endonuclease VapC